MKDLVIGALATKRLVRLITADAILDPVREKVWEIDPPQKHRVGYVLTCESCSSMWAAAAVTLLISSGVHGRRLAFMMALSETAVLLSETMRQDTNFSV